VPNAFPFKEQVLAEKEDLRRRREEERERKRRGEGAAPVVKAAVNGQNGVGEERVEGVGEKEEYVRGIQIGDEDEDEDMDYSDEEESDDEEDDEDMEEDDDDDEEEDEEGFDSELSWKGIRSDSSEEDQDPDSTDSDLDLDTLTTKNTSRNALQPAYMKPFARSSVILFVLDARCPELCRSSELETFARKQGKKIVYVLNRAGTPLPVVDMAD